MERLNHLLDEAGWAASDRTRRSAVFQWMEEATKRIEELQAQISEMESNNEKS